MERDGAGSDRGEGGHDGLAFGNNRDFPKNENLLFLPAAKPSGHRTVRVVVVVVVVVVVGGGLL